MKKLLKVVLFLTLSLNVYAQDTKSLKSVMHSFASAMELIQHGILYNDIEQMHKGAQLLKNNKDTLLKGHTQALVSHMPENPEFAKAYAQRTGRKINEYSQKLGNQLDAGKKSYSLIAATYTNILHECVGCHQKIRRR